jgi:hypothetical protein
VTFRPSKSSAERERSQCSVEKNQARIKLALGVFILEDLVHALKLSLPLLRELLLPLLVPLDPFQGIVCVRIGVTQSSSLERRIELSLVSHPANIA